MAQILHFHDLQRICAPDAPPPDTDHGGTVGGRSRDFATAPPIRLTAFARSVRGPTRTPDHDAFDAVLRFARACASLPAHTAGSCPPYFPAVTVLAYAVCLRGIEVNTLTDANLQTEGIRSNRRKASRDNVTLWTKDLRAAVKWLQSYRDERMQAHGRPVPIKP